MMTTQEAYQQYHAAIDRLKAESDMRELDVRAADSDRMMGLAYVWGWFDSRTALTGRLPNDDEETAADVFSYQFGLARALNLLDGTSYDPLVSTAWATWWAENEPQRCVKCRQLHPFSELEENAGYCNSCTEAVAV